MCVCTYWNNVVNEVRDWHIYMYICIYVCVYLLE
jgi:hypothetical protein